MDLYMSRVPLAASEEDVKIELAKILHRPPFPLEPPLNFDLFFYPNSYLGRRGKTGILSLPDERVGQAFLRAYGQTGVPIKGPRVLFCPSTKPVDQEKLRWLRTTPWRDPMQLRAEKEQRIQEGRPYELTSYAFGRFLVDGSFSSECFAEGFADIACDLDRRQVRFTLYEPSEHTVDSEYDYDQRIQKCEIDMVLDLAPPPITVSYQPTAIVSLVDSRTSDQPILFIRSNSFPVFAIEEYDFVEQRHDFHRAQGLISDTPMPPGTFHLMCTFKDIGDKDAFVHACKTRFHLHHTSEQSRIQVHDNTSKFTPPNLDFLRELPFELAFELEKAIINCVLSMANAQSLRGALDNLRKTHGNAAAATIFRNFITLLEDDDLPRHGRWRTRTTPALTTLEARLSHAVDLYLKEQARPRGRLRQALDSPAISYSYHMILTPTRYILEGPVVDQSNSVLRRFGHHDCFLRVSFQDENRSKLRRDLETSITDLLSERYRPVLLTGSKIAGRRYEMLGYSMSGLREHSLWFVRPFRDDQGRIMTAQTIRESLGDFSSLQYMPAKLGARWSQAFSATDPSITLEHGEIEEINDITSPSNKVMTDGCSPISPDLARAIWRAHQKAKGRPARGKPPSAFQFRLGGAKGVVVQDPTLEGRIVQLRPSQIKFDAPDNRTFDIQSTSKRPKPMFLNRPLIVLLEFLESNRNRIIELQDRSIKEAHSLHHSFLDASKVVQQHGLGSSFHLPSLLRNMSSILNLKMADAVDEEDLQPSSDLINSALHCAETHVLRELKYRAHIAVPGSWTLLGVSDEWDCLEEGEIYATVHDEKTGLYQAISGQVAVTRSPQMHPGDVQIVTAVRRKELQHLTNVVVFSCKGDRSLSSCLGGGDLDGDDFNLILDPGLIPETTWYPGDYTSLPVKRTHHPCGVEDVVDFIFDYIESDLLGHIAISHLRFSDSEDPSCEECLQLAELASQAVDFPKTGTPVNFRELPKLPSRLRPDFLAREGADLTFSDGMYYNSEKLLGELFRRVPQKTWMPREWTWEESPSGGDIMELALRRVGLYGLGLSTAGPTVELREEMDYLLEEYCKKLFAIAKTHTTSKSKDVHLSEAELVSGTIMANWPDRHRKREAVGAMNLQTHELVRAVRAEMRGTSATTIVHEESEQDEFTDGLWWEADEEDEYFRETRYITESFKRAWAAWCVAEDALKEAPAMFGPQSFGLIALGRMLELIKAARLLL